MNLRGGEFAPIANETRLSGPLRDRMDLIVDVPAVPAEFHRRWRVR